MKAFKKRLVSVFFGLCILLMAPCILPNQTIPATVEAAGKTALNKTRATMIKGQKLQLKLNGTKKKVTWSTSSRKVAAVSAKGVVTAKKAGTVSITAKAGKKKFVCKITVEAPSISSKTLHLTKGKKYTLKMKGTKQKVTWQTSDRSVAGVSKKGVVSAKKPGTATITAKIGDKKYVCRVTVETPKLSKTTATVTVGKKITLKMNGTKRKVTWSSSNKSVATVSSSGVVTGKKAGTATITAKVGKTKFPCKVTVKSKSGSKNFSVSSSKVRIPLNGKKSITVYSPSKSKLSYKISSGTALVSCKWGKWDKSNRRSFTITGMNVGKATIEITEKSTNKKKKITVEIYRTGKLEEPKISYAMGNETVEEAYFIALKLYNEGTKPLRIYSDGAQSVDVEQSEYNRSLQLVSVNADGTNVKQRKSQEIPPKSSAIVYFYTAQPTRYSDQTCVVYVFSYDGKLYGAYNNYYESGYLDPEDLK